jgi:sn-glycerol 3-phosphate transport system substrate-binding protein
MKYRLLILFAVFAMVAAACSSGDDSTDTTAASGGSTETTAASGGSTETTVASADATTIDFWVAFSDEDRLGFAEDRAAEFNAGHPEYNIKVTSFASYNDVFDAAVLAVDSGSPPGLIHFFEAATREALDAVDASGTPIFKSVTDAIGGRTEILGEPVVLY